MKVYLEWLENYVDVNLTVDELSHLLTMAGLEIEGVETVPLPEGRTGQVLELNITPNRGYCLSHIGVAREVAALTGQTCTLPETEGELARNTGSVPVGERLTVVNQEDQLCPRYAAMVIENVTPGPSPQWLAERLTAVGLRPINNIVDITNYVLMEYGQPLHAFDAAQLAGSRIVVRRARKNEPFTSLDGTDLKLDPEALVIADAEKPVALAGIMGGMNSQVTLATRSVVLESACFDPLSVRQTSRRFGLRSESSYRFERGVDIEAVTTAQTRAALLIRELAGGTICRGRVDLYPHPREAMRVAIRVSRTNKILGARLSAEDIASYLRALGMNPLEKEAGEKYLVEIPSYRPALQREIDLIEEVARLYGYDHIGVTHPTASISPVHFTRSQTTTREGRVMLTHLGYSECVNYSFIQDSDAQAFLPAFGPEGARGIPLKNPISSDMGTMRTSLLPGLLRTAERNLNRGQKSLRLFEQGNVFFQKPVEGRATQIPALALLATGPHAPSVWKEPGKLYDFYDLKGALEAFAAKFKVTLQFRPSKRPFLDPEQSVDCLSGERFLGYCGGVAVPTARQMGLEKGVYVWELDLAAFVAARPEALRFQPIPRFPETYRDISILVDKTVPAQEVSNLIREASGALISRVDLYDQFEGKKLEPGKKSLTFALAFQSPEKTLSDEEVNPVFQKIVHALSEKIGARLRE